MGRKNAAASKSQGLHAEFTSWFASLRHMPITRAIFGFWLRPDDGPYIASAMGVIGMATLLISLAAASIVLARRWASCSGPENGSSIKPAAL